MRPVVAENMPALAGATRWPGSHGVVRAIGPS